jgi:hypothetical protein
VTGFKVSKFQENGSDTTRTGNFYCLVRFRVENKALRVSHKWNNSIGYIIDETGRIYENNPSLQQLLEKSQPFGYRDSYVTPAGSADSTCLAFELPSQVKRLFFKVRGEILMGDIFDRVRFRRMMVRLY